jgi:hypothetical protein
MHTSIHNSDRKGIKYRMSYPRWSTSLVVNKQFWSDQSAVDQNETSKRNQLPHDPTTNPGIRSNGLWSHHPNLIQTLENVQRIAARFVINDNTSRTPGCVTSMLTSLEWQTLEQRRRISRLRSSINSWTSTETYTSDLVTAEPEVNIGSSRRGPIMTLSETPSKEQHESGTTNSEVFSCT